MISGSSEETTIDGFALSGELFDQAVNLGFRSDVDPARRLVEQQDLAIRRKPTGDDRLLLVSAGEEADRPVDLKRTQIDVGQDLGRLLAERAAAYETARGKMLHRRQRDIVHHGALRDDALPLPFLRHEADARGNGGARAAFGELLTVQRDRSRCRLVRAGDQPQQFGSSRADQSGDAENLAAAEFEARVYDLCPRGQIAHRQDGLGGRGGAVVGDRKLSPDHHRDNSALGRLAQVDFADELPVAHDGRAAANLEHLVHLVGDIDDRNASRREVGDHDGETLELAGGQAGRRLVHRDDARVLEQRASDLDDLPLRDLQGFDLRVGADRRDRVAASASAAASPGRRGRRTRSRAAAGGRGTCSERPSARGPAEAPGGSSRSRPGARRAAAQGQDLAVERDRAASGFTTPDIVRSSVDFPAPFSPRRAWTSPDERAATFAERLDAGKCLGHVLDIRAGAVHQTWRAP